MIFIDWDYAQTSDEEVGDAFNIQGSAMYTAPIDWTCDKLDVRQLGIEATWALLYACEYELYESFNKDMLKAINNDEVRTFVEGRVTREHEELVNTLHAMIVNGNCLLICCCLLLRGTS